MRLVPHSAHAPKLHQLTIPEDTEPSKFSSKGLDIPSSNSMRMGYQKGDGNSSRGMLPTSATDHRRGLLSTRSGNTMSKTSGNIISGSTLAQLALRSKTQRTLLETNTAKYSLLNLPPYAFEAASTKVLHTVASVKDTFRPAELKHDWIFSKKKLDPSDDSESEPQPIEYELECQARDKITYRLQSTVPMVKYKFICKTGGKGVNTSVALHHCDGGIRASVSLTRDPTGEHFDASCATNRGSGLVEWNYDGANRTKTFYCLLTYEAPSTFNITFKFQVNHKIPLRRNLDPSKRQLMQMGGGDDSRNDMRYYHDYLIADIERMETTLLDKLKQRRQSGYDVGLGHDTGLGAAGSHDWWCLSTRS